MPRRRWGPEATATLSCPPISVLCSTAATWESDSGHNRGMKRRQTFSGESSVKYGRDFFLPTLTWSFPIHCQGFTASHPNYTPSTGNRPWCSHSLTRPPSDPLGFSTQSLGLHCPCSPLIFHLAFLTLNQTTNPQTFSPPATSRPHLPTKSPPEALPLLSFKTQPQQQHLQETSLPRPLYHTEEEVEQRLRNLPKITQQTRGDAGTQAQGVPQTHRSWGGGGLPEKSTKAQVAQRLIRMLIRRQNPLSSIWEMCVDHPSLQSRKTQSKVSSNLSWRFGLIV